VFVNEKGRPLPMSPYFSNGPLGFKIMLFKDAEVIVEEKCALSVGNDCPA